MEAQMKRGEPSGEGGMLDSNSQKRATRRRWLQKIRNMSVRSCCKEGLHLLTIRIWRGLYSVQELHGLDVVEIDLIL